MNSNYLLLFFIASTFLFVSCDSGHKKKITQADTIYQNGKIYTANNDKPWVESVAIKNGRIIEVGSDADVKALTGDSTVVIDMDGKFMMPGIFDLHAHPFITPWYGSMNLSLINSGSSEDILSEVRAYAEANPEKQWIIGGQWLLGVFPKDNPSKKLLDDIVPDRPVALLDQTGHSMWLNSKAMELAGITIETPSSQLIVIEKDGKTGEPTGTIREQALQLVERVIQQATPEEYAVTTEEIFDIFLSFGITSMQTAEGHKVPLDALKLLESQGKLRERVFVSWDWKTTLNLAYTLEDIEGQINNRSKYASDMVYPNYVKIFADGGPGSRTSLLLEPYEGTTNLYGGANMSTEELADAFMKFDNMGVGVHVHAMGDGTIRRVVDALEIMKNENGESGVRHKIAHNTMITYEDLDRLATMKDVNIDFSPPIWYPHIGVIASFLPQVGEERMQKFYPFKYALESGLHVGQGSDWLTANPTPNPFIAIEGMVTRKNPFDPNLEGTINASQAISLEQAITVATIEGATVLGVEEDLGSIEVGKFADMIILENNLFEIEPDKIDETQVLQTIVNGKVVYKKK